MSAKILAGEKITMSVQTGHLAVDETIPPGIRLCAYPPGKVDVLDCGRHGRNISKRVSRTTAAAEKYILGAWAARRIRTAQKLDLFLKKNTGRTGHCHRADRSIGFIDVKKEERCLLEFSEKYRIPFLDVYSTGIQGSAGRISRFRVREDTGGRGQCERAAMKAAGTGGWIFLGKQAQDGMTVAVAEKKKNMERSSRIRMWQF